MLSKDNWIGLGLALSSTFLIGSSFIFQKKGLQRRVTNGSRAADGGCSYIRDWLWLTGFLLMGIGEVANFAAYGFAPSTLVAPLGALSVIVSALLSARFLKEHLNIFGLIGSGLCLVGATEIVLNAPQMDEDGEVKSVDELLKALGKPFFVIYALSALAGTAVLSLHSAPRFGATNPLVYLGITALVGSLTVCLCKTLSLMLRETLSGRAQYLLSPSPYILGILLAGSIIFQMRYLQRALDRFSTTVVTPLLYVLFTSAVVTASLVLFREWASIPPEHVVGLFCGFLTTVAGIFLLTWFRDLNVPWSCVLRTGQKSPGSRSPTGSSSMNGPLSPNGGQSAEAGRETVEMELLMPGDARAQAASPSSPAPPLTTLSMIPMADTSRLIMSVASAIHAPLSSNSFASGTASSHSTRHTTLLAGADLESSLLAASKLKNSSDDSALFRHSIRNAREPPAPVISQSGLTTLNNRARRGGTVESAEGEEFQTLQNRPFESGVDSSMDLALSSSQSSLRHMRNPSLPTHFRPPSEDSSDGRQQVSSGYAAGEATVSPLHPAVDVGTSGTPSSTRQHTARSGPLRLLDRFNPRARAAPGYSPLSDRDSSETFVLPFVSSPSRQKGILQDV